MKSKCPFATLLVSASEKDIILKEFLNPTNTGLDERVSFIIKIYLILLKWSSLRIEVQRKVSIKVLQCMCVARYNVPIDAS